MFTRPSAITDADVAQFLRNWGIATPEVAYRAVGFGSHHWDVWSGPNRWFLTVDDLDAKSTGSGDSRASASDRLRDALDTARQLCDAGLLFVVAPIVSDDGQVLLSFNERYAGALYGYVEGETFEHGEWVDDNDRVAVLSLLAQLHTTPAPAALHTETFRLRHREELTAEAPWADGPYANRARALLVSARPAIAHAVARYDDLSAAARGSEHEFVVTHGEPHRANTIRTADGFVLIDWDTVRVAHRERDLWMLGGANEPAITRYHDEVDVPVKAWLFELYDLQWDLIEIAGYLAFFRGEHSATQDAAESWKNLEYFVGKHLS